MEGGTISRNAAEDLGGGVNVNSGKFTMSGGVIGGEEKDGNSAFHGGGVCIYSGTFEMSGGAISGNNATGDVPSGKDGYGGGVMLYLDSTTFIMSAGSISGNMANAYGGGVSLRSAGSFTMINGEISGNKAYYGGGVYLTGSGKFTMSGGTISKNTADRILRRYRRKGFYINIVFTNSFTFLFVIWTMNERDGSRANFPRCLIFKLIK